MDSISKLVAQKPSLNDPRSRKDSLLYQKRIKVTAPLDKISQSQAISTTSLNPDINTQKQLPSVFSQQSHDFQRYSTQLGNIEQRVASRKPEVDENQQLAIKAADADSLLAVESARYFLNIAIQQQNMTTQYQTTISNFSQQINSQKIHTNSLVAQLEAVNIEFHQDKDLLISQINKIKSTVQECQLIAAELGFPVPQQPELLEILTPQCFENDNIVIDGQVRTNQQISLQLLLAEQQVLRNHNFLMKQMISDIQKQKAGNLQKSGDEKNQLQEQIKQQTEQYQNQTINLSQSNKLNQLSSKLLQQCNTNNPVEVFQKEFQSSGVAVARELLSLRAKTASMLLREQQFDENALLERSGSDDQTLRSLVIGLQNQLKYYQNIIFQLQKLGLSLKDDLLPDQQLNLTEQQIKQLSNIALQENIDVDLLPNHLARMIDNIVQDAIEKAQKVVEAKVLVKNAELPVEQLQLLIEKRDETMRKLDTAAAELLTFLKNNKNEVEIEEKLQQFAIEKGVAVEYELDDDIQEGIENANSLTFAQAAFAQTLDKTKQFDQLLQQINNYIKEVIGNLKQDNYEKFGKDGSGYCEVLEKVSSLIAHSRKLHVEIAQRDFCISRLQRVISYILEEKHTQDEQIAKLVASRNGLLKAYFDLQRGNQVMKENNETLRMSAQNCVQLTIDQAVTTYDGKLADALSIQQKDYTTAVKKLSEVVKEEVLIFQDFFYSEIENIGCILQNYADVINNKKQVGIQTDRTRKMYDEGIQVSLVVEDKKKK